jgi:predicted transcriptional regulator
MTPFILTLNLPEDLARRLAALPAEEVNAFAVAALSDLVSDEEEDKEGEPDPDLIAALRRGLAEADAGNLLTLEEAQANFDAKFEAALAAVREQFEHEQARSGGAKAAA